MDIEKIAMLFAENGNIQHVHFNDIHENQYVLVGADQNEIRQMMSESSDIVKKLAPIFFNNLKEAENFVHQIQNMKPKQITALVSNWVKERKISEKSCNRDLWTVLYDSRLYPYTESNWNSQVKR